MNIYKITNTHNGKVYIGQTVQKNPKMRWYQHCADARSGKESHLCYSMRKYGVDKFLWEVIDTAVSMDDLNHKEELWLNHYKQFTECYNIREAGGNKLHNPESIEKMKLAQKAAHARRRANGKDGGWIRRDGGPMKGRAHPGKGKKRTPEQIENIRSAISTKRKNYRIGKVYAEIDGKKKWINLV